MLVPPSSPQIRAAKSLPRCSASARTASTPDARRRTAGHHRRPRRRRAWRPHRKGRRRAPRRTARPRPQVSPGVRVVGAPHLLAASASSPPPPQPRIVAPARMSSISSQLSVRMSHSVGDCSPHQASSTVRRPPRLLTTRTTPSPAITTTAIATHSPVEPPRRRSSPAPGGRKGTYRCCTRCRRRSRPGRRAHPARPVPVL